MSTVLTSALAYRALKKDKNQMETTSTPKTFQESIFAKPMTWLIVAGVGIYFTTRLIKNLKKKGTLVTAKSDVVLLQASQNQSYLDSQYSSYADVLFSAMDGLGTDEDAIMRVFSAMKNDLDVAKLITAYGVRKNESLAEWLQNDLSSSDMSDLNKLLSTKGIKYQF
jgi:hypothetical protein